TRHKNTKYAHLICTFALSMALIGKDKPEQHAEMPFFAHIEALRWHIARSAGVIVFLGCLFFFYNDIVFGKIIFGPRHQDFITYRVICKLGKMILGNESACIQVAQQGLINTDLAGQFTMHLWVSFIGGLIVGMPYVLWELWRFIRPALKNNEAKPAKGFVWVSTLLFLVGVSFSYFLIFPLTWNFLAPYVVSNDVQNLISFDSYVSNLTTLTLAFGLVFEMPVVVYFLSRLGLMTPAFMRKYRRHAIVVILVLAAFITPTSDIPTQLAVFAPLYVLYEASIFVSAYVAKKQGA
ncbi:MAG TPA: twin-arginine translocase subunit TatC, partial [Bacteroidia bacterium]|nr:twin-arginine translocase subunit TatC [Bacteroidia bacterium]